MAFFDVPPDEELSPEVRHMLEDYRRVTGTEAVPPGWKAYGRLPKIVEARLKAYQNLSHQCRFPWDARNLAVMLIAHTKRCRACFAGARYQLDKLGFDETALDGICANPDALPLKERERLFVHYALRIATSSADLTRKDFEEMAAHGFSKEEIQEIIAFAAYWVMNMVFSQATYAALAED
jgi:uncharacterized peroxidase-related enzyme